MSKPFKFLTPLLLFLSILISPVSAFAATLSLSPSSGTLNTGCSYSIDILLDTQSVQTDGTDARIFYDPTRFGITSLTKGTLYPDYPASDFSQQGSGGMVISISGLAAPTQPFAGSGKFATINFNIPSTAPAGAAKLTFDFTPGSSTDSNVVQSVTVTDVLSSVINGNYTIASGGSCSAITSSGTKSQPGIGGETSSTPSAIPVTPPLKTLSNTAGITPTVVLSILGGVLTLIGIAGFTLL